MPEINTTFTQGRMNLDLEEKILPNGEYRGALNIQVSTSDEDSVGSVQPIMGNEKLTTGLSQGWSGYECIGSIADEKNDVAYWFIVKDDNTQSAILRCFKNNTGALEVGYVLVDTDNTALEFTVENYITGINVIDNFLYFTDGVTEPKFIDVNQFLNNTVHQINGSTSSFFVNDINLGAVTKNDITVIKPRPLNPISVELVPGDERNIIYDSTFNLSFAGKTTGSSIVIQVNLQEFLAVGAYTIFDPDNVGIARDYFGLNVNPVTGKFQAKYGGGNNYLASAQNSNYEYYDAIAPNFEPGDILLLSPQSTPGTLPSNVQARIKITSMAVKPIPYTTQVLQNPPPGYINRNTPFYAELTCEVIDVSSNIANKAYDFNIMKEDASKLIFEKVFPRFSYRYKYSDNQYSAFAPFTQPAFLPGRFNIHPTKEPTNTGMENNINKIILRDFVHQGIPRDVVEIDLLYKEDGSPTVFLIDTIKPKKSDQTDVEAWHTFDGSNEAFTFIDGTTSIPFQTNSGYYELTKEILYSALPENQMLRVYDNVPKKAKAQDFTAGRIIYANYTQNLNVRDYENNLRLNLENRNFGFIEKTFDAGALKTVKSQRTYQVGISLLDYQGRETPVFTSGERGSVTIPFNQTTDPYALIAFEGNASKSNRLKVSDIPNVPSHINNSSIFNNLSDSPSYDPYYFKLYVKETSSEYYNLVLDRVYRSKEDSNLWLSFPSADRNKIKEDDFIILKKPLESDTQVQLQNKFKVIAIRNESPDFIRDKFRNLGTVDGDGDLDALYPDPGFRPAAGQRKIVINKTLVVDERVNALQQMFNRGEELAIKFKKDPVGGTVLNSEIYNITSLELTGDVYIITFDKPIRETDGWVEQSVGIVDPDLKTLFFKVENKQWQEFQGRFFVKILSNIVTAQYLEPMIGAGEIFNIITARAKFFSLRDGNLFRSLDAESRYSGVHEYGQDTSQNTNLASNNNLNRTQNFEEFESLFNFNGTSGTSQGTDGSDWFIDELHYVSQQPLSVPDTSTGKYDIFKADAQGSSASEITSRQDYDASISGNLRGMNFNPIYGSDSFTSSSTFTFPNTQQIIIQDGNNTVFRDGPLTVKVGSGPDSTDAFKRSAMGSPMNGMQGIVKTVTGHLNPNQTNSAPWPLAWKKQLDHINASATDNYREVYGDSTGRHFIHLSFSGVGVDLVDEDSFVLFDETGDGINYNGGLTQYIGNGFWRAGVPAGAGGYPPSEPEQVPGGTMDLQGIVNGNRQKTIGESGIGKILPFPQRPNSTLNDPNLGTIIENQWNPVGNEALGNFSAGNEAFINKLQPGNFFRFTNDLNLTKFEILRVEKVRVYNHTPWNRCVILDDQNAVSGEWVENTNSVGYAYDRWISKAYQADNAINRQALDERFEELEDAVIRFGRANNRRICYIIEVDKDPTSVCSTNPESLNFDNDPSDDFSFIEFFEQDFSDGENPIKENPAIFETEPKEKIDLDLYYEASPIYPLRLDINSDQLDVGDINPNNSKGYLSAKVGAKVKVTGTGMSIANTYTASGNPHQGRQIDCRVKSWDGNIVELAGGISAVGGSEGFDYIDPNTNVSTPGQRGNITHQRQFFKDKFLEFYDDEENGYIKYKIDRVIEIGITTPTTAATAYESIKKIRLHPKPEEVGLPYFNAFSFGNGVESNRIRDDFNQTFIKNGARVSTTLDEKYKQDTRTSGLIFSGIYNKSTSLNDLNQFIQAENITKELDNTYGSIQKLFARNSDLIALCEDKIVQIFADKDLIFNADGNTQLTASNKVLGQSRPFVGEYGISKNPESFASSSYRAYFTDKQRGAVLRLSMDGLTPISDAGMRDWFRDKLKGDYYQDRIIGSYDKTKNDYNLTFDSGNNFAYVEDDFGNSNSIYKNENQSITVTYKENVKGWSSFKGFIQEAGVVVNNEYITFRDGKAFHHNENVGACHFYDTSDSTTRIASVNAIFNDAPLSIKNFNTLNYVGDFKGDQGRVPAWTCNRLETERGEGRILSTPFGANSIIDNPNVDQFVKKEEKAFAYIQHTHGETDGTTDNESGSNLGIGAAFENESL